MNARSNLLICAMIVTRAIALTAQSTVPRDAPTSRIYGVVIDESRVPIPDAQLRIHQDSDSGRTFRTGTDGIFVFAAVPDGPSTLTVRRLGYAPRTLVFDASSGQPDQNILVVMKSVPAELADVVVLGQDSRLHQF